MKTTTKYTMQYISSKLRCYSWPVLTGEPNKAFKNRQNNYRGITAINFGNFRFGCFRHFRIANYMSHVLPRKCRFFNSDFVLPVGGRSSPQEETEAEQKRSKEKEVGLWFRSPVWHVIYFDVSHDIHKEFLYKTSWITVFWHGKQLICESMSPILSCQIFPATSSGFWFYFVCLTVTHTNYFVLLYCTPTNLFYFILI